MQYDFAPLSQVGTLGSTHAFDCAPVNNFPTAPLYKITAGSSVTYTIDTLEEIRAAANGDTVQSLGRSCVGLPGDTPVTSRVINLLSETDNRSTKY